MRGHGSAQFSGHILSAEVPLAKIVFAGDLLPRRLQDEDVVIGG